MNLYNLTRNEIWVLCTLLHLPLQQGSVLSEWLGKSETPSAESIQAWLPQVKTSLTGKGFFSQGNPVPELLQCLMLAVVNQKHLHVSLRTGQEAWMSRFMLTGSGVMQYSFEEDSFTLYSARQFEEFLPTLLPEWLPCEPVKPLEQTLSLSAFLLFKQACLMDNLAYLLNTDGHVAFTQASLEKSFPRDNGWVDVFHTLGFNGVESLDQISPPLQLESLLANRLLEREDSGLLKIGSAGRELTRAISDPNQAAVTLGYSSFKATRMDTHVFLAGDRHLFRLEFSGGLVLLHAVQSRRQALEWIRGLVQGE